MPKVIITVTNDIVGDNRMHKTATTLVNAGFDVRICGVQTKKSQQIQRTYKTIRFRMIFRRKFLFYAEYNLRLFFYLLFSNFDIVLSVDLDTLLASFLVSKIRKKKIVFDSHELFTELPELINRPLIKAIWQRIERLTLPKIQFSYTVCNSIANFYRQKYGLEMKVVRNVPFYQSLMNNKATQTPKIIIYQGSLNIGRGIEQVLQAMTYLDEYVFWIVGEGYLENVLKNKALKLIELNKVVFWGRIKLEDLPKITQQAHIGISLEHNLGLSYFYALPNKIFDYINAEIPVLCSDLPEMRQIIEKYNVGEIVQSFEPSHLANQIRNIVENPQKYNKYIENTRIAKQELCWEKEQQTILDIFCKAIHK